MSNPHAGKVFCSAGWAGDCLRLNTTLEAIQASANPFARKIERLVIAGPSLLQWTDLTALLRVATDQWKVAAISLHTDSLRGASPSHWVECRALGVTEVLASAIVSNARRQSGKEPTSLDLSHFDGIATLIGSGIAAFLELPVGWPSILTVDRVLPVLASRCRGVDGIEIRRGPLDLDSPFLREALQRMPRMFSEAITRFADTLEAAGIPVGIDPSEGLPPCMFPKRWERRALVRAGHPGRSSPLLKTPVCETCALQRDCAGMHADLSGGQLAGVPCALPSVPLGMLALRMDPRDVSAQGVFQGGRGAMRRFRTLRNYLEDGVSRERACDDDIVAQRTDYEALGMGRLEGMRVCLTIGPGHVDEQRDDKNSCLPPLAFINLASFLRSYGCTVRVQNLLVDPAFSPQERGVLSDKARLEVALSASESPADNPQGGVAGAPDVQAIVAKATDRLDVDKLDLLGVSSNNEVDVAFSLLVARELRRRGSRVPVVVGRNFNLPILTDTLRAELHYSVMGDGELPLALLCQALATSGRVDWIPGLSSTHPSRPAFGNRRVYHDFDLSPPPDLDGLELDRYRYELFTGWSGITAPYQFISGCLYNCAFCSALSKRRYRRRAPALVVRDLLHMHRRHGIAQFFFINNMFNVERAYCDELLDRMIATGVDWHWTDSGRPSGVSIDLLRKMRTAGCEFMTWGVDTTSDRLSKLHRKNLTQAGVLEVLKAAYRAGIRNHINILPGLPGERPEDVQQMVRFLRQAQRWIHTVTLSPYEFVDHSDIGVNPARYGLLSRCDLPGGGVDELRGMRWEDRAAWTARACEILRAEVEPIAARASK